ncbi:hypothetical protein A4E84_03025 [Streptomyces qaidamensis]|uniref:Uncharacterized protein n=1 Tax=Streptomyces qaidamensis TaxID=1783515 RepID=A0A143BTY1_9ACTN|nr:DUF6448 family protein [Streptomyces qaidamensis]AMW08584.1 hypothetical protein A4E84_03025 [Streptomyces qaidamensis]
MPPRCDSLDGPVVTAARTALEGRDVDQFLPYVPEEGEREVREAFSLAAKARTFGREAQEVTDRWFFETVVRAHRSGEGAPFTGLKPAGLDVGPVIPVAEHALDVGSTEALTEALCGIIREQVEERHGRAMALKKHAAEGVTAARAFVEAGLGVQVWAHHVYKQAIAVPHAPTRHS